MGQFVSGQSKPIGSGKKKGGLNKKSKLLGDIFWERGFSIPDRIVDLLPTLAPEKQADILLDLMSYLYPKRKSIEIEQEYSAPEPIEIIFVNAKDGKPADR